MSIPLVEFSPLSKTVPQIGFGCARLVGRSTLRQSAKILEAALDLGIRYFDVAPSYGMGTAEDVLGEVLGNSKDVIIATKIGIPRPAYSAKRNFVRIFAKPVLDRMRPLKTFARRFYAPNKAACLQIVRQRHDFSATAVNACVEESLRRLRRDTIDIYLAHEPHYDDLGEELADRFTNLVQVSQISTFGVGIDMRQDRWKLFGSIWQSGWPGEVVQSYANDVSYVFHGTIRYAPKDRYGKTTLPASQIVRDAMRLAPKSIILVSTSTPQKLRELIQEI